MKVLNILPKYETSSGIFLLVPHRAPNSNSVTHMHKMAISIILVSEVVFHTSWYPRFTALNQYWGLRFGHQSVYKILHFIIIYFCQELLSVDALHVFPSSK